jgi:gluconokinase
MGPSGSGKSTLGRALATHLGWRFVEGDDHHPPDNLRKLASGEPLSEADRQRFLAGIGLAMAASDEPVVVSCSALRRAHRDRLRSHAGEIPFVWLDLGAGELAQRMERRRGHFMAPALLANQLESFEPPAPPERFIRVDGKLPTLDQVRKVTQYLTKSRKRRSSLQSCGPSEAERFHGTASPSEH